MQHPYTRFSHLECPQCGSQYDGAAVQTYCTVDDHPLLARYTLEPCRPSDIIESDERSMWRYGSLLPVGKEQRISLGEGWTPLLSLPAFGRRLGISNVYLKDESANPTGSFKARGLSMAVSKAHALGIRAMCIPTAGNAGSALSAYGTKAGMAVHIYMPEATPSVFQADCRLAGAQVTTVEGNIGDAARRMRADNSDGSWFDGSTLKEPYRLEGKKTMGYEIAEQMQWQLPDVILYPTGGGTGLIGIWKAFSEMMALGWIDAIPTRMVAVQVRQCQPIVAAFQAGATVADPYPDPGLTIANGLRVPHAFGHRLILRTLYESGGTAIAVDDDTIKQALSDMATTEGLLLSPEGAAVAAAAEQLQQLGWIRPSDRVVLLNTGSVYKYMENLSG